MSNLKVRSETLEPFIALAKSVPRVYRSAADLDLDLNSLTFSSMCDPETDMAIQSAKDESDINLIVKRYGVTGMLPQVQRPPTYEDFSGVFDFRSAMDMVVAARESFEGLDASIRKRFGNDPAEFVAFCEDAENLPEMRKMGIAIPERKVDTTHTPPVAGQEKANVASNVGAGDSGGSPPSGGSGKGSA